MDNHHRDRSKGLGLGLSIVQRLSALLKAELSLHTVSGKGSVFSITLLRDSSNKLTSPDNDFTPIAGDLAGKTVIVIDDEEDIRAALKLLLSEWGCKVVELASVAEVEQKLQHSYKPDMILADYRLHNHQTGVDVIHAIHDLYQDTEIPAVIITGDTAPERIKQANESGFQIIHKPVAGGKLRALLNSMLLSK